MVDLQTQYAEIKDDLLREFDEILDSAAFIGGPQVKRFATNLAQYLDVPHVVPCANGTDALQVAMMALGLKPGDEVIVPTFTYIATVEVIALLQLKPVFVDVDYDTFNLNTTQLESSLTPRTRAVVPVHLYGQCCDLAPLVDFCQRHNLHLIEDTAQAIGAQYTFPTGKRQSAGTIGTVGCTSFYPSKNLGAYGDAGATMTRNAELAADLQMVANHGQKRRYYFDAVGVNSRLDTLQAAVLDVKLRHLPRYTASRQAAAAFYDQAFANQPEHLLIPGRAAYSTHVFHQYTLRVKAGKRDALQAFLAERGIPSVIFYPLCAHQQTAYLHYGYTDGQFPVAEQLASEVLSLPMHSELGQDQLAYIADNVLAFFKQ